jgi:ribosome-associated protein
MLKISGQINIPLDEIEFRAIRSQGTGGQKVNKVATAIHLRFDIKNSSLPKVYQQRLLKLPDRRVSQDGIIIIKAQQYRTQKKNKEEAILRLQKLIKKVLTTPKIRKPTRATPASCAKRLESKIRKGQVKRLRKKITL